MIPVGRGATLILYTVYDHPDDYPDHVVVRAWHLADGAAWAGSPMLADDIAAARELIPARVARVCVPRDPADPAAVVETWI